MIDCSQVTWKREIKNMRTSALNRWMPLLGLSPSMHILARLRRPYDLCVPNQTYDMAWPHVLPRSDSSFLCPHTSCIYMHGNLTCMHYIEGSIGLMSWSSNSKPIVSNLSFYCFWLLIRRLSVLEVPQSDQVENIEIALWKICLPKPQTTTKIRAGQEASCVGR